MTAYTLIRSKRKTVALSVTGQCEVVVRAPVKMPLKDIESFVKKHTGWIDKHITKIKCGVENRKRIYLTDALSKELKQRAKEYLTQRTEQIGGVMGVSPAGVKITSARTRWGSCSGKNGICFSYRVMLLPEDLIDYIIVHELTHIRVKNHSGAFYVELARYIPNYRERSKRLKQINMGRDYMDI